MVKIAWLGKARGRATLFLKLFELFCIVVPQTFFSSPTNFFPIKNELKKAFFVQKKVHLLFYREKKWLDEILSKEISL